MVSSVPTIRVPTRANTFHPDRTPLRRSSTLQLNSGRVHGPIPFLNPTKATYTQLEPPISEEDAARPVRTPTRELTVPSPPEIITAPTGFCPPQAAVTYQWTSRNSRKGRHKLLLDEDDIANAGFFAPTPTSNLIHVARHIGLMFTSCPLGDISYDVAILFTIGSAVWVLNGFFTLLPLANPHWAFPGQVAWGGGITAFIGILIFFLGGVFTMFEAVNEDRLDCFG